MSKRKEEAIQPSYIKLLYAIFKIPEGKTADGKDINQELINNIKQLHGSSRNSYIDRNKEIVHKPLKKHKKGDKHEQTNGKN